MRFLADGLNIPDELLEDRDRGNVVFLCGAGVSYSAGMPTFLGLAKHVVEELGTPADAPSRVMLAMWEDSRIPPAGRPPLDQIFNLLQQEYLPSEIDCFIARRLTRDSEIQCQAHQTVLRLSKNADGNPQIVTTNFDRLFENAAADNLKTYVPPTLPDLTRAQAFSGLVYLHGRVDPGIRRGEGRHGLVVSSSDFGRAYLAEGWATRFIRRLLEQYTVVLLGYSASDPPVRYLLQGLHTRREGRHGRIFSFDGGTEEEVQSRWRDSGVRALAYPAEGENHSTLWETLSAWADRADNPAEWRRRIVDLARKGPRRLAPHERGQVASLVRTDVGAKLFADADPAPTAEWLCVFDRNVRCGKSGLSFDEFQPTFNPHHEYGLDDDPLPPTRDWPPTEPYGDDLLSLSSTGHRYNELARLAVNNRFHNVCALSPRLSHLIRWIVKVAGDPAVPWWVAKYSALHSELFIRLERRVEEILNELPPLARQIWSLLIEKISTATDDDDVNSDWYKTLRRIKVEGWTDSVLRAFERNAAPYLRSKSPLGLGGSRPPSDNWSEIKLSDIVEFEVVFPGIYDEQLEIRDDVLPTIYRIVRKHLELAAGLLSDAGVGFWNTLTFYPEDRAGDVDFGDESAYFFKFKDLLDRMVTEHRQLLRADIAFWPKEERYFFNKLHLYAWSCSDLFYGDEVGNAIVSFSDEAFWNTEYRRELLHLLRLRWNELPSNKRQSIELRLVEGRARYNGELKENYERSRSITSAIILGWLKNHGCELTERTVDALTTLRCADPRWSTEWDDEADRSYDGRSSVVRVDSDPSSIIDAPVDQIIQLAIQHTRYSSSEFKEHEPFYGLVIQNPGKAIDALKYAARQDDYPLRFWRSALQVWPDGAGRRLVWLFADGLAQIPSKIVFELRHELFGWVQKRLFDLAVDDHHRALSLLDSLLDKLFEGWTGATESAVGDFRGEQSDRPRKTLVHAVNSPVGKMTELLLDLLRRNGGQRGAGIPQDINRLLERLLSAPGEWADHTICIVSNRYNNLSYVDPKWVHNTVFPWFNLEAQASESAWQGLLYSNSILDPKLFVLVKNDFLRIFNNSSLYRTWDSELYRRLYQILIYACYSHLGNKIYITFEEARSALRQGNDDNRVHSLWYLGRVVDKNNAWRSFGKPFLEKAWPREAQFQTEKTSRQYVRLAREADDLFPEMVETVLPYLVPISRGDSLYRMARPSDNEESSLATRFPDAALALLDKVVPDDPSCAPFYLSRVIEMIAEVKPGSRQDRRWQRLQDIVLRQ